MITEHWSAYHYNFQVEDRRKLKRIQAIFRQPNCTVITISEALQNDIKTFCDGDTKVNFKVVPNTVETTIFHYAPQLESNCIRLFMLSKWQPPKTPDVILRAFARCVGRHPSLRLCIAGYGEQYPQIEALAEQLEISAYVDFIGRLDPDEIATEMNRSHAFLHASEYETFSVVCAEALCCGVPVVASAVGGLKEVVGDGNGVLVQTEDEWDEALKTMIRTAHTYDRKRIAEAAQARYSFASVGRHYYECLAAAVDSN